MNLDVKTSKTFRCNGFEWVEWKKELDAQQRDDQVTMTCPFGWVNRINGNCYRVFRKRLNWIDARTECEKIGGELPTINNHNHLSRLLNLIKKPFWTSIKYIEGRWVSIGGKWVNYLRWKRGYPRKHRRRRIAKLCVQVDNRGLMINRLCNGKSHFLCFRKAV